jgi:alanyl-tRNA synthetase
MADENTSTTDVSDDTGSATDAGQHDDVTAGLGEGGQKALAAERKRAATAERTAKASQKQIDDLSRQLQEFQDRDKTDAQKLTEAKTAAEKTAADAQARLMRYEVAAAKKLPAEWAARLQGSTKEDLEADADALMQALGTQQQRQTPNYDGGVRTSASAPADMNALIRRAAGL